MEQEIKKENDSTGVVKSDSLEKKNDSKSDNDVFKVPISLLGIGKKTKPKRLVTAKPEETVNSELPQKTLGRNDPEPENEPPAEYDENEPQDYFGYKIPKWSKMPPNCFLIKEIKDKEPVLVKYVRKEFYLFGRKENCHIVARNASVSRYHAVIQFGSPTGASDDCGFYIFDLNTTHGTFVNKKRILGSEHVKLEINDKISFGYSTRYYILEMLNKNKSIEDREREVEDNTTGKEKQVEDTGIDWGMGEDADEEADLKSNPYAESLDEELYINDPKKTLRGWFEREGKELIYDVEEKGRGEFTCKIKIPVDEIDETLQAEATLCGKKKAVVQAALEACRVLDKHGLLRQSHHASKAKVKDWEADDFYDSDDDSFFDRTGDIDKKRIKRMKAHGKVEKTLHTFETLMKDHSVLLDTISNLTKNRNKLLKEMQGLEGSIPCKVKEAKENLLLEGSEDSIARFLNIDLIEEDLRKIEEKLKETSKEEERLVSLLNFTKPMDMPKFETFTGVSTEGKENVKEFKNTDKRKNSFTKPAIVESKHAIEKRKFLPPEPEVNNDVTEPLKKQAKIETAISPASSSISMKKTDLDTELMPDRSEKKVEFGRKTEKTVECERKTGKTVECENSEVGETSKVKKSVTGPKVKPGSSLDDYSTTEWMPPAGQTGDGRTHLNDKYGY